MYSGLLQMSLVYVRCQSWYQLITVNGGQIWWGEYEHHLYNVFQLSRSRFKGAIYDTFSVDHLLFVLGSETNLSGSAEYAQTQLFVSLPFVTER